MIIAITILFALIMVLTVKIVAGWRYRGYRKLPAVDLDEVAVEDGGEDEEESARDTRLVIPALYEATIASPAAAATMAAAVQRDAVTSTPISTTREVSGYHSGESLPSCDCQFYHEKEMKLEKAMTELKINDILNQLEDVMMYQSNVIDWQEKEIERLTR